MNFDMDELASQVGAVLNYSQGIDINTSSCANLIQHEWYPSKMKLMEKFLGGNLTKEFPGMIFDNPDNEEKLNKLKNKILMLHEKELYHFLDAIGWDCICTNKTSKEYKYKFFKTVPAGAKTIRAFKYFVKDEDTLKTLQSLASEVSQTRHIEGTLVLSVHPLDYLSLSENAHNWESCHRLQGDRRAGNLSYMCDSSTMVAYLKAPEDCEIPNFPIKWNTKKWRALVYLSNTYDTFIISKHYPFHLDAIEDKIAELFFESESFKCDRTFEDDYITYMEIEHYKFPLIPMMLSDKIELHYNDITACNCANPYMYGYQTDFEGAFNLPLFNIGHEVGCLKCGATLVETDSFICDDCAEKAGQFRCCRCGERYPEDEVVEIEHEYYCADCYEEIYGED